MSGVTQSSRRVVIPARPRFCSVANIAGIATHLGLRSIPPLIRESTCVCVGEDAMWVVWLDLCAAPERDVKNCCTARRVPCDDPALLLDVLRRCTSFVLVAFELLMSGFVPKSRLVGPLRSDSSRWCSITRTQITPPNPLCGCVERGKGGYPFDAMQVGRLRHELLTGVRRYACASAAGSDGKQPISSIANCPGTINQFCNDRRAANARPRCGVVGRSSRHRRIPAC
ncbi:hypothetical protein LZ31DRAFT_171873 [Colletotrichum somersetense]|nr:hypothetical protein LZ31DRAFT_171873 [Colletotrichum somersetense]